MLRRGRISTSSERDFGASEFEDVQLWSTSVGSKDVGDETY
jgi:hypothetical protein